MVTVGGADRQDRRPRRRGACRLDLGHGFDDPPDRGDDDDSLHVGSPQPVQRGRHVVAAPAERDEAQEMPGLPRRRLNAEEHVRRSELFGLDGHDPEGPRASTGEDPRRGVGVVAESGNGVFDPDAGSRRLRRGTR